MDKKIIKVNVNGLETFSIYEVELSYTSKDTFPATVHLLTKEKTSLNQFITEIIFLPGTNKIKFNITTNFYGAIDPAIKEVYLYIFSRTNIGFIGDFPLTSVIMTGEEKKKFLIISHDVSFKKVFDIRLQASDPNYINSTFSSEDPWRTPPIILHGFYNNEDGLGAHLSNLYEKVFYDYKTISFNRQLNRTNGHFSFLNREKDVNSLALPKYAKDFKWMNFYFSNEHMHVLAPNNFKKAAFIHVGGLGVNEEEIWADLTLLSNIKKFYDAKTILYLMWESTDIEIIKPVLDIVDTIVVTNSWLKEVISQKLPEKEIYVVEHIAKYYTKKSEGYSGKFVFGYSGGLWARKNVDIGINAFNNIKTPQDQFKIHSRDFVNTPEMLDVIKKEISKDSSGIELRNETLKDEDYFYWWNSINCYVFISGGESYSITPRQALMQGIPVILSKNTSHLDLLDIPGILWVETTQTRKAQFSGDPSSSVFVGEDYFPSLQDVEEAMLAVKNDYQSWKQKAIEGGEILKQRTSPERIKKQWDLILI